LARKKTPGIDDVQVKSTTYVQLRIVPNAMWTDSTGHSPCPVMAAFKTFAIEH
jgi:hypothetical protein